MGGGCLPDGSGHRGTNRWIRASGYQQMGPGIGVLTSSRRPSYTSVFTISSVSSVDSSIYLMDTLQSRAHERKLKMIVLW